MNIFRSIGIFMCGVVCAGNIVALKYGVPPNYDAHPWKIALAILITIGCIAFNYSEKKYTPHTRNT